LAKSQKIPISVQFWSRVNKTESCWLWTGAVFKGIGYGQLTIREGKKVTPRGAHRISWELNVGPIPDGLFVLHNCPGGDNKLCVNPDHLYLGTHQVNMDDAANKGQMPSGKRNGLILHPESVVRGERVAVAKLNDELVRGIRSEYDGSRGCISRLSRKYKVDRNRIRLIVDGKAWSHVE
jgi:hypothetical protein